ncbi:hypothetical protein SEA_HURRICANE_49 [Mycobacterium phage Hurricane]|uniref:Uncharacterized protein n=1 Tax=Mycobacterium phage Hurricane TaxID=2015810 RepID=A0A222ZK62_9CAUD|nr:hypothetical protein I5G83_gp49 [Mycobacterium phage Hurricane]ASR84795.1 hypothetical protein SEA_HURRICANE_49 [Mycobacterium phage Hurricane]
MQLGKHIDVTNKLKRERDEAVAERDAGRRVIAALTDQLAAALRARAEDNVASYARIELLTGERDAAVNEYAEADAAHRVALADLAEQERELSTLRAVDDEEMGVPTVNADEVRVLHPEPDMERYG